MIQFLKRSGTGVRLWLRRVFVNPYADWGLSWLRVKILKHQSAGSPRHVYIKGMRVNYVNPRDLVHSIQEIFVDDIYRLSLENERPFIIDCGANIGLSIIRMKMQFPKAKIIGFEPDEINYSLLCANIANFQDVEVFPFAVWSDNVSLNFDMQGGLGSCISEEASAAGHHMVKAVKLRDYLSGSRVDLLKMDIEGAEYEVIRDCSDVIGNAERVFLEYHGTFEDSSKLSAILDVFLRAGFMFYIREAAPVHPHPFAREARYFFDVQLNIFAFKNV